MNKTRQQFLELLRAGLWGTAADPEQFKDGADWKGIIDLAREQTVLILVADGYATLPPQYQPSKTIQFNVEAFRVRMAQMHALLNKEIKTLSHLMDTNGIRSVLLKGQGLARNYPKPLSRACGDIDLYVGEDQFDKAKQLLEDLGVTHGEESESEKHYHCNRGNIVIELHRFTELLRLPWENRRYQEWTRRHLIETAEFDVWNMDDHAVNLPPVQFNVLYVFYHFYNHFQTSGIALRQICDWAMFLHTHAGQYDKEVLKNDLKAFGLRSPWKVFAQMVVDYLGLPADEMPLYTPSGIRAGKALDMVLTYGNFGRTQIAARGPRPKGYYSGKLYSFFHTLGNNLRLFPIFPVKTIINFTAFTIHGTIVAMNRKETR